MGNLHEFHPDKENLSTYLERVQIFFAANEVSEEKQVPLFLNAIGGTTYALLRSLLAPVSPKNKTLEQITTTFRAHFEPKPSLITERFHFHKRNQATGESIADYIAKLRRLASRCSFPRDYLDDTLRNRFVYGLRSESIQKSLLSAEDLSLSNVVAKAQSLETAHRNAQALKHSGSLPVSKVYGSSLTPKSFTRRASNEPQAAGRKPCHRCGKTGHTGQDCSFHDAICHRCRKKGHIAKVCRGGGKPHNTPKSGKKVTRWVGTEEPQDVPSGFNYSEDVHYNVYTLGPAKKNPYKIIVTLTPLSHGSPTRVNKLGLNPDSTRVAFT